MQNNFKIEFARKETLNLTILKFKSALNKFCRKCIHGKNNFLVILLMMRTFNNL